MTPASKGTRRVDQKRSSTPLERLRRVLQGREVGAGEDLFADIAEQVFERRRAWDLSQQELAELCGTTQSAIARIERGLRPPRIDTLHRIARALDCELSVELVPRTREARDDRQSRSRRD